MRADYHVHTEFSDDSEYSMEQVVKDAISKGLDEICFTDHVDYGIKKDWDDPSGIEYRETSPGVFQPFANADYPRYYELYRQLKEKYAREISLKLGMEFGMQMHTVEKYEKLFARYPFDFIILSIHQVDDKEFWTQDFQSGKTWQQYNERYYEEMLHLVKNYHNYSILGHVDLITRYDKAGVYPFEKIKPLLTEIFKTVIADGKGIELNTSSHRYGLNDLTPAKNILKLYRQLGGRIITIGSDSHKAEHLNAYIDEGREELKKLGYTEFCTFRQMQPIFHKL